MNDQDTQDYYDRKVRRAEETLIVFVKLAFFVAIASGLYALIAR